MRLPIPDGVCVSMYDGCMCELEAPHPGVDHQCSHVHELQTWTTEQGEQWARDVAEGRA